jgi:hypothetical protein
LSFFLFKTKLVGDVYVGKHGVWSAVSLFFIFYYFCCFQWVKLRVCLNLKAQKKSTILFYFHDNDKNLIRCHPSLPYTMTTEPTQQLVIVYGGELAKDVAEQIVSKKPAESPLSVSLRRADERPKTLVDLSADTIVCFVMQTIENGAPTEDVRQTE